MSEPARANDRLLTVAEAARRLGCDPKTVKRKLDAGTFQWVEVDGKRLVQASEVEGERARILARLGAREPDSRAFDQPPQDLSADASAEVARLRRQIAEIREAARVLLWGAMEPGE